MNFDKTGEEWILMCKRFLNPGTCLGWKLASFLDLFYHPG
jgi:hypothetical protein